MMKTLQDLVRSLDYKEGIAKQWSEKNSGTKKVTFREQYNIISDYSRGFLELGLNKGDVIAIFSGNNPHWIDITLGANNVGIIDVPRGETSTSKELEYIIMHSEPKILIVEDEKVLNKIDISRHPEIKHIYSIHDSNNIKNISEIQKLGKNSTKIIPEVSPDDIAGRIYTSGTTAEPKGVELSHYNFISNVEALQDVLHLTTDDSCPSFLPAWHVFERTQKYLALCAGINSFYTTTNSFVKDLRIHKPTMVVVVPRVLVAAYDKFLDAVDKKGLRNLFNKLYPSALDYSRRELDFKKISEYIPHKIADLLFLSKVRKIFGGRVKYLVCGSSSLARHVEDFFTAAGMDLLEGYGLTEASPVVSARIPGRKMHYSLGRLLKGIEGKIIDPDSGEVLSQGIEGVLHVRGPNIMKGYYKDEEETKKVLNKDGWLNTGDRAYFTKENNLVLTGREKEIIVLSNGENINPAPLEDALSESEYISAAVVIGKDSWKNLALLILPNFDKIKEYYKNNKMTYDEDNPMLNFVDSITGKKIPEIEKLYSKAINELVNKNERFRSEEHIKHFEYIKELRPGEELTATLKIIRRKIAEVYHDTIEYMHQKIYGENKSLL